MKQAYNMFAFLLFLAASVTAREITVEMWDFHGDGWNGASLGISVNGALSDAANRTDGFDPAIFRVNVNIGENVIFYWHKGDADGECAFAAYYTDEPPSIRFNPNSGQNNNDVDALLLYKLYGVLSSASEDEALGSFTAAPPKPVVTVSPQSALLPVGGTRKFSAVVKNLDAPDQSVTWSVSGAANSGTVISADGVLTVSPQETAAALTVKAACNANPEVYAAAAVSVTFPYTIGTAAELAAFADSVNSGTDFRSRLVWLTAEIDLSGYGAQFNGGKGWIPIGKTSSRFRGDFDGGGHVIRNLYINDTTIDYVGLFGYIDSIAGSGSVKNLGLVNVNVRGKLRVGGIAGSMNAGNDNADGLTDCYVTGSVSGNERVGGIVGQMNGGNNSSNSLTNCYSAGSVSGSQYVGGIVGQMSGPGNISRCYSAASVNGAAGSGYVGGIAGSTAGGISYCAALNPGVKGSNNAGRVTGGAGAAALSANIAFANMLNRAENRNWNNKGPAAIDGEDISPNDIRADGTLGGRFEGSPWVTFAGKLPGLGGAVDMPDHIADFYVLRYIVLPPYGTLETADTLQTIQAGANGRAVTVTGNLGYTFARWSDGSTDNPRQDTNVLGDITVTAYFMDEDGNVSVLAPNRIIPQSLPDEEATVIAPVVILSGEFTAGPNPLSKRYGIINFYRQGRRIAACELRIYDANGNIINKVKIKDNALGSQSKRIVGSWDLTDRKGRQVSEGTYLLRGVITLSDGKKEKISYIISVR